MQTELMIADGLTKPLQGKDFIRMRHLLLNSLHDILDIDALYCEPSVHD